MASVLQILLVSLGRAPNAECLAARTGHMESALHGLQRGGPQSMDLLYPPVDDLDDDVGIVDAEVLELLLSRPN